MSSVLIINAQAAFHGREAVQFPALDIPALTAQVEQQIKRPQTSEQDYAIILQEAACKCIESCDYTACEAFRAQIGEKSLSSDLKTQFNLALARYYIYKRDYTAAMAEASKYAHLSQISFDLESQSKVYVACLHLLEHTDLYTASNLLITAISTFSAEELISFADFTTLCFTLACGFLDRAQLRRLCDEQVDAFTECDHRIVRFAHMMIDCKWSEFSGLLAEVYDYIQNDFFLHEFKQEIVEKITAQAYQQYLQAFLATTVHTMAQDFGIPLEDFKRYLEYFIFKGDVRAKIDAVHWKIMKMQSKETDRLWAQFEEECGQLVGAIENMQRGK